MECEAKKEKLLRIHSQESGVHLAEVNLLKISPSKNAISS